MTCSVDHNSLDPGQERCFDCGMSRTNALEAQILALQEVIREARPFIVELGQKVLAAKMEESLQTPTPRAGRFLAADMWAALADHYHGVTLTPDEEQDLEAARDRYRSEANKSWW